MKSKIAARPLPITLSLLALCTTACGSALTSGILTSDDNTGSDSGSSSQDWSQTGSTPTIRNGNYSFVYTNPTFRCTDGASGVGQGGAMQMAVDVSGGYLTMRQNAVSASSSQQKVSTTGMRVISSTDTSGPVSATGAFVATSTALFDDAKYGYIRTNYKIDGRFSGNSWSGKYDSQAFFEEEGVSCTYSSTFTGSLVL
jgi:hypothetical protein